MIRTFLPAAILAAGLAAPLPASALPLAGLAAGDALPDARIIPVYGGCGPFGHRGPYGGCRRGGQWGGYIPGRACPPGWHIGPYGRRCWRNG
ncbi:hypothetical protein Q8W71_25315 [Methylobacterium sp. NEAU 140]|uniref:GCG_CRPN prefix-to-repeats domain-containing protein n=1 Tax=Methylobacterium sp. NEAU 140 TaxID=3064945 RepID=UPI0027369F1B|nr:hypothetical protein [Methylobacterium sp. NEAU 140]MDP4025957.1 hypothetical protein [Methylobacterium sp. NEAU 140]